MSDENHVLLANVCSVDVIPTFLLLLLHQGPGHMPWMHRSLQAYCANPEPPPILDVPTSATRCPHVDARDPSSEMWNLWARTVR